jgi:hypothetical protein
MSSQNTKNLEQCLPDGQLVNRAWLKERGFNRVVSLSLNCQEPGLLSTLLRNLQKTFLPRFRLLAVGLAESLLHTTHVARTMLLPL